MWLMKSRFLLRYLSKYNHIERLSYETLGLWRRCGSLVCDKEEGLQKAILFGLLNFN